MAERKKVVLSDDELDVVSGGAGNGTGAGGCVNFSGSWTCIYCNTTFNAEQIKRKKRCYKRFCHSCYEELADWAVTCRSCGSNTYWLQQEDCGGRGPG